MATGSAMRTDHYWYLRLGVDERSAARWFARLWALAEPWLGDPRREGDPGGGAVCRWCRRPSPFRWAHDDCHREAWGR